MNSHLSIPALFAVLLLGASHALADATTQGDAAPLGYFTGHQDVGSCARPGGILYDSRQQSYTVAGGGANM